MILGSICWHSIELDFLSPVVPDGKLCIETTALMIFVTLMYFVADWKVAIVFCLWAWPQLVAAQYIVAAHEDIFAVSINGTIFRLFDLALYLHIFGWLAQFWGHFVNEGRAPALMTNLFFALLAPFFVTFEFMNHAFGFKEGKEMDAVRVAIKKDIA